MFTIKFYSADGCRQRILSAESFTVLREPLGTNGGGGAEITLHMKNPGDDCRIDVRSERPGADGFLAVVTSVYAKAIIENAAGRTTEIISVDFPRK